MAKDALRFLGLDEQFKYENSVVLDKTGSVLQYIAYMLNRTSQMFTYEGLPDTIPAYILEQFLQTHGVVAFSRTETLHEQYRLNGSKSGLYVFFGSLGGVPDIYLRPTQFVLANPQVPNGKALIIGKDCEIMKNDTRAIGLFPLFLRYAQELAENDISIRCAQINSRQRSVIKVQTDREKEAAVKYLNQLEAGELGYIGEDSFFEGVDVLSAGSAQPNGIIQLIELQQYLKASWFNEIGLNTNFNMKREYLSAEEIAANTDVLLPLVDDMLECRQKALEKINAMFGTNISVTKNSSWDNKSRESEAELEAMENDASGEESEQNEEAEVSGDNAD